jgi:malonyl-CoA O-methyltransferase
MFPDARHHPGKKRIEASFSAKADRYDEHAVLQEKVGRRLEALFDREGGWRAPCADLGCGPGRLHGRRPPAIHPLVGVDLSAAMLARFRRAAPGGLAVRADVEALPLRTASLGAAILGLVLQWTREPRRAVKEVARCLKPGGVLGFSVFLEGTLEDFYDLAREKGRAAPVAFFGREEFLSFLDEAGLEASAVEVLDEIQYFAGAREALKSLSAVGAAASGDAPMTRPEIEDFCREYDRRTRLPQGVPLDWKSMIGLARKRGV